MIKQVGVVNNNNLQCKAGVHDKKSDDLTRAKKIGIFATSVLGLGASVAILAKRNNFSLNPKNILNTPFKDTFLGSKDFLEKEVITMGLGSCAGGLLGGALFDKKENFQAKCREAVVQLSNIVAPILVVGAGSRLGENLQPKIKEVMKPKFEGVKLSSGAKTFLNGLPKATGALIGLAVGVVAGNKLSQVINGLVFNKKDNRPLELSDLSVHVDDTCAAASFISKSPAIFAISRIVPAALVVPGIEVGTTKER